MRVLIDTNVVVDYVAKREPYAPQAYKIIKMCADKKITGCIAAHTITNIFYILRKELSIEERRAALLKLCRVFTVAGIDIAKILSALENENFEDLEDCLQDECAEDFIADYIITRNVSDFKNGKTEAIEPIKFLSIVKY